MRRTISTFLITLGSRSSYKYGSLHPCKYGSASDGAPTVCPHVWANDSILFNHVDPEIVDFPGIFGKIRGIKGACFEFESLQGHFVKVLIRAMSYHQITALLGVECPQLSSIEGISGLFAHFLPTLEKSRRVSRPSTNNQAVHCLEVSRKRHESDNSKRAGYTGLPIRSRFSIPVMAGSARRRSRLRDVSSSYSRVHVEDFCSTSDVRRSGTS